MGFARTIGASRFSDSLVGVFTVKSMTLPVDRPSDLGGLRFIKAAVVNTTPLPMSMIATEAILRRKRRESTIAVSYNILYVPDDVLDSDFYADSDEDHTHRQLKLAFEEVSRPVAEIDTC
jgi:hypothetical protein